MGSSVGCSLSDSENNSGGRVRSNVLSVTSDDDNDVVVDGVTVLIDGAVGFMPFAIQPERVNVDGTNDACGRETEVPVVDDEIPDTLPDDDDDDDCFGFVHCGDL